MSGRFSFRMYNIDEDQAILENFYDHYKEVIDSCKEQKILEALNFIKISERKWKDKFKLYKEAFDICYNSIYIDIHNMDDEFRDIIFNKLKIILPHKYYFDLDGNELRNYLYDVVGFGYRVVSNRIAVLRDDACVLIASIIFSQYQQMIDDKKEIKIYDEFDGIKFSVTIFTHQPTDTKDIGRLKIHFEGITNITIRYKLRNGDIAEMTPKGLRVEQKFICDQLFVRIFEYLKKKYLILYLGLPTQDIETKYLIMPDLIASMYNRKKLILTCDSSILEDFLFHHYSDYDVTRNLIGLSNKDVDDIKQSVSNICQSESINDGITHDEDYYNNYVEAMKDELILNRIKSLIDKYTMHVSCVSND